MSASSRSPIPYLIVAAFVGFALFIGSMVRQAMNTTVDLVSADYYQQELDYQQRITATAHAAALPAPVTLTPDADRHARHLTIALPPILAGQATTGVVHFFRPSASSLDFTVPFQPDAAGRQLLSLARLQPGYWRVRLEFAHSGQTYFVEGEVNR